MRANLWLACEGGPAAVEAFLGEKGNAALKLDQGAYAAFKKRPFNSEVQRADFWR